MRGPSEIPVEGFIEQDYGKPSVGSSLIEGKTEYLEKDKNENIIFNESVPYRRTLEYTVGPEDVIEITVWEHDDLHKTVSVPQDGFISFPLIGRIRVAGLTAREVAKKITVLLEKDYLYNPYVTVDVREYKSKKVSVLGEVGNPGLYYLTGPTTISDILSKAGGVSGIKKRGEKVIVRRILAQGANGRASSEPIIIDLYALLVEGDTNLNILLRDGDTVYVPEANVFSIFGEVGRTGTYELEKGLTLLRAITQAGGFTIWANPKKVSILRTKDGREYKKIVNVKEILEGNASDIPLYPQDILIVPKRFL